MTFLLIALCIVKDDRDDPDGAEIIERDVNDLVEEDPSDSIEHSDPVYDYQLDIDCNEMPITIDELSMGVGNSNDMVIDGGECQSAHFGLKFINQGKRPQSNTFSHVCSTQCG